MGNEKITKFVKAFSNLRTDKTGGWTSTTKLQAPHKPLLLLSILDLFAQKFIQKNFIEVTPELGDLFSTYWQRIMPPERRGNIALPFFHLRSSGFWHLIPQPGQDEILRTLKQVHTLSQLKKVTLGARLDDDLFEMMQVDEGRDTLWMRKLLTSHMSLRGGRTSRRSNLPLTTNFSAKRRLLRDEHPRNDILVAVGEGTYIFTNPLS